MMNETRLLFGKPVAQERGQLIKAIRDLQSRHGLIAQALDASLVVSERHIHFAVQKALSAFCEGRNIANDAGVEIMRYASGERQIERALVMGISDRTRRIALILAKAEGQVGWPDDSELCQIIEPDGCGCSFDPEAVKDLFHISSQELEAVGEQKMEDLVIERVALVDTYR
jgi:KEOPS complex subunit Cgi121